MTASWAAGMQPESEHERRAPSAPREPRKVDGSREEKRRAAYVEAALQSELERVRCAGTGTRNHTLNRAAFALGQLVAGGHLDRTEVVQELTEAALQSGLTRLETKKTIASGLGAGEQEPRELPEAEPDNHRREANGYESEPPPGMFDDGDAPVSGESDAEPTPAAAPPVTPSDVVMAWRNEGPLVRIPTGIVALDKACRGGLPVPWRVFIIGAPSAGKTLVEVATADNMARAASSAGACVGILAVDEEPEDITVRLLQIAGFTVAEAEARDPEILRQMSAALDGLRVRLYDLTWTIELAAADLASWAKQQQRHGVLFVDSLQTARSNAGGATPRESVEANVRATRWAATTQRLLVIATSEANRASYRNDDAAKETNDMAAGAETRSIEFGAQTLLMLRTPKDEPDTIHVRIAKNRRAYLGEFWLRLDRERHRVTECDDPHADPDRVASRQHEARQTVKASVLFDAEHLASVLRRHPDGLGERALRAELRAQGFGWGTARLGAARAALAGGHKGCRLVEASEGPGKAKVSKLVIEPAEERAAE